MHAAHAACCAPADATSSTATLGVTGVSTAPANTGWQFFLPLRCRGVSDVSLRRETSPLLLTHLTAVDPLGCMRHRILLVGPRVSGILTCIRRHTAYSIRKHTRTSAYVGVRQHPASLPSQPPSSTAQPHSSSPSHASESPPSSLSLESPTSSAPPKIVTPPPPLSGAPPLSLWRKPSAAASAPRWVPALAACISQHPSASVSICQHTSAYVRGGCNLHGDTTHARQIGGRGGGGVRCAAGIMRARFLCSYARPALCSRCCCCCC